jgi:hypothetical protein
VVSQVRDLSLNFWLVLPSVSPASSPVLHPVLEGVFNFLLVWAALFVGFAVDGKPDPAEYDDKNAFGPYLLMMQVSPLAATQRRDPAWLVQYMDGGWRMACRSVCARV